MTDDEIIKEATEAYNQNLGAGCYVGDLLGIINRQKAENERLQKLLDDKCDRCISRDKSEARKELAEQLKKELSHFSVNPSEVREVIDNVLKEMEAK